MFRHDLDLLLGSTVTATSFLLSEPVCAPQMQVITFLGVVVLEKMSMKLVARSRE